MTQFLDLAGQWFVHSGIQSGPGGIARYYRTDLAAHAPVSTEITGYALSALLYFHHRTGQAPYFDAAVRAAHFLTRTAWDPSLDLFPFELSESGRRAYFFDTGIILRGLLAFWRACGDREPLGVAERAASAMASHFSAEQGFHPVLILPARQPLARDQRWSLNPGCYQLKAALAWHEMGGDLLQPYQTALNAALCTHSSFLPGPTAELTIDRLHAYCYFLEGLLPVLSKPECALAFREGLGRVAKLSRQLAHVFERSDVYAQLLRLRLFASVLNVVPLDECAASQEASLLAGFQCLDEDPRRRGGFWFGRKAAVQLPFVNPVSTVFAVQALEMWADYQAGCFNSDWRSLI